jgi:hypothetical protein
VYNAGGNQASSNQPSSYGDGRWGEHIAHQPLHYTWDVLSLSLYLSLTLIPPAAHYNDKNQLKAVAMLSQSKTTNSPFPSQERKIRWENKKP